MTLSAMQIRNDCGIENFDIADKMGFGESTVLYVWKTIYFIVSVTTL